MKKANDTSDIDIRNRPNKLNKVKADKLQERRLRSELVIAAWKVEMMVDVMEQKDEKIAAWKVETTAKKFVIMAEVRVVKTVGTFVLLMYYTNSPSPLLMLHMPHKRRLYS